MWNTSILTLATDENSTATVRRLATRNARSNVNVIGCGKQSNNMWRAVATSIDTGGHRLSARSEEVAAKSRSMSIQRLDDPELWPTDGQRAGATTPHMQWLNVSTGQG